MVRKSIYFLLTARNTVNRLARKQLHLIHVVSASTHVQYTRTDSVRIFDVRSVRTVKAVTNREHLSYGPHVSFRSLGLHLIKDVRALKLPTHRFFSNFD